MLQWPIIFSSLSISDTDPFLIKMIPLDHSAFPISLPLLSLGYIFN